MTRRVQWLTAFTLLIVVTVWTAAAMYWRRAGTGSAPIRIRLAVLPVPAGDSQADLWSRGLAEDLMTRLGAAEGVQVIAETSAFSTSIPPA
jgi:TolB-like protein